MQTRQSAGSQCNAIHSTIQGPDHTAQLYQFPDEGRAAFTILCGSFTLNADPPPPDHNPPRDPGSQCCPGLAWWPRKQSSRRLSAAASALQVATSNMVVTRYCSGGRMNITKFVSTVVDASVLVSTPWAPIFSTALDRNQEVASRVRSRKMVVCSSLPPHLTLGNDKGVLRIFDLVAPLVLCRTGAARCSSPDASLDVPTRPDEITPNFTVSSPCRSPAMAVQGFL